GWMSGRATTRPFTGRVPSVALAVYDHGEERVWRHLDSCQFQTYLHARPPRGQCPTHGVRQGRLARAEPRSRFTTLFERLAIDVLRESDISGATAILPITWDEAWHLLERAVARGQARKGRRLPRRIGVDEKAMAKGHRYLTLVCDLETPTIEYVAEDRKQASLAAYFAQFPESERATLTAVALDMWAPYEQAIRAQVPQAGAKMVFDRFHIMSHMNQAVDRVRRREHRELHAHGDDRLTGTKHVWGYGEEMCPTSIGPGWRP